MKRFVPLLALALTVAFPPGAFAAAGGASPAGVSCAAGDPVVWINTESKVYHLAGSSYYGKTKHGKYACASDATKMGAHAAKRESGSATGGTMGGAMGGSTSGAGANGTPAGSSGAMSPGATSGSGKHHRRKGGLMASPVPNPNPT